MGEVEDVVVVVAPPPLQAVRRRSDTSNRANVRKIFFFISASLTSFGKDIVNYKTN